MPRFCLDLGTRTKTIRIGIYIMFVTLRKKPAKQAKNFRQSILKGSRQMIYFIHVLSNYLRMATLPLTSCGQAARR